MMGKSSRPAATLILYVWPPDHETRPGWLSNLRTTIDEVSFIAPIDGLYQVEVYGYGGGDYQLAVEISAGAAAATVTKTNGGIDPTKSALLQPLLPVLYEPGGRFTPPVVGPPAQPQSYLPLIQR